MQLNFSAIALALFFFIAPAFEGEATINGLERRLAELESDYHVQIHCEPDPSITFPRSWLEPSLRMATAPIYEKDAESLLPALEDFLASHPATVIAENLEHIYLLGKLRFRDRDYGGTHAGKSIYIVWDQSRKNTPGFILERIHSEFSSILRDHYPFPAERWLAINPEGFRYSGSGFEMLGTGSIYESAEPQQEDGFLAKYSMSSLENDFNIMSAWLFTRSGDLDIAGRTHERIQRKRGLAEAFYRSISNQYSFHQIQSSQSL